MSWEWYDALGVHIRGRIWGAFPTSPSASSVQPCLLDARGEVRASRYPRLEGRSLKAGILCRGSQRLSKGTSREPLRRSCGTRAC